MTDDNAMHADSDVPEPDGVHTAARRSKRGPIIVAVSLAVVVILAVVAILVVPGIVTDRKAQAAADAFAAEREQWAATFTSEALAPYVNIEATGYEDYLAAITLLREETEVSWNSPSSVPDAAELDAACVVIADLAEGLTAFEGVSAPSLEETEGGEQNADYASARELYDAELSHYEASEAFVADAERAFSDIDEACVFFIAENAVDRALADEQNGYVSAYTMAEHERVHIGTEQVGGTTLDHYLVCVVETGCVPLDDMDARATTGDLWDAAAGVRHLGRAEQLEESCPGELEEACAARRGVELTLYEHATAIGEAYRSEDPVAIALATDEGDPVTPQLDNAYAQYEEVWIAEFDVLEETTEQLTGHTTLQVALDQIVVDAFERIAAAAVAVSEGEGV